MKISLEEVENEEGLFLISLEKDCLKKLHNENLNQVKLLLDFELLNLGEKLYGNSKSETLQIQKNNCKKFLKYFKVCKKAVKFVKRKNPNFDGKLYIKNLSQKKNNNDFMLVSMLEIMDVKFSSRFQFAYETACAFLDKENSINNMCDFQNNICAKHRDKGDNTANGCCPSFCDIRVLGKCCQDKNLSCKIFMCDYLINEKGFYFTPHTIPILKKYFTFFERAASFGVLCRSEKKSLRYFRFIRFLTIFYILVIIGIILLLAL